MTTANRLGLRGHLAGKWHAAQTLARLMKCLVNWPEVWRAYRTGTAIPELRFRRGFVLTHGAADDPIGLLHEIFGQRIYRWRWNETPSGVALDCGANIGSVFVDWVFTAPDLTVHAYEPNPAARASAIKNVDINGLQSRVVMHDEALGNSCGHTQLSIPSNSVGATKCATHVGVIRRIQVPQVDLNRAVQRTGCEDIWLAKIDIEGAEAEVLEAADAATLQTIKRFVVEYHEDLVRGSRERCLSVLARHGFECETRCLYPPHTGLIFARHTSLPARS